jgi:hypothetical protein
MAELKQNVIRIRWNLIVRTMAFIAIGVHQLVIAIQMACLTIGCHVSPFEREAGRAVIEGRR